MQKDIITRLIDKIEDDIEVATMLNMFQIGLALKIIEYRLWDIDKYNAQRCNDLQHKILEDDE